MNCRQSETMKFNVQDEASAEVETKARQKQAGKSAWAPSDPGQESKESYARSEPIANVNNIHNKDREAENSLNKEQAQEYAPERIRESGEVRSKAVVLVVLSKRTKLVDKRRTVMSVLLTNGVLFNYLHRLYKNKTMTFSIFIFWFCFDLLYIFVCFEQPLIPSNIYLPLQLFYTLNFCVYHSFFIRVDIVKELARSFNFWYALWSTLSYHVCFVLLWSPSSNIFGAMVHSLSSIILMILYDANSAKRTKLSQFSSLVGSIAYLPIIAILVLSLVDFWYEKIYFKSSNIEIIDIRLQALDNIFTVIVYLLRISYTHLVLKTPNSVAFLSDFYTFDKYSSAVDNVRTDIEAVAVNTQANDASMEMNTFSNIADEDNLYSAPVSSSPPSTVHPIASPGTANQNHENSPNELENYLEIGIHEKKILNYDTHQTIFHQVISVYFPKVAKLMRSKYYNFFGVFTCSCSIYVSIPMAIGVNLNPVVEHFILIFSSAAIFFILAQVITASNYIMLRFMFRSFDFWFVMYLILKIFVSSGILCGWDKRIVIWIMYVFTIYWCIMVETFTLKSRNSSFLALVGTAWSLLMVVLCKLNIGDTFDHDNYVVWNDIHLFSPKIDLSTATFSVALFTLRFFYSHKKNKHRLLFITENYQVLPHKK